MGKAHAHRGQYKKTGRPEHMLPSRSREERLASAEREASRLRKLALDKPIEAHIYRLAADRVQREEVEPLKRLIEAHKRRSK
jgi:hypothetical protein